jgi:hypothetical protein
MAPDVKYQIFVSSPFRDLRDWRKELMEKILELDHIPSGMELFSAGDDEDWSVIRRAIDQCDIYVVVVGALFGSVIQTEGVSFTQREFRYARDVARKPILAFLVDGGAYDAERAKLAEGNPKSEADAARAMHERKHEDNLIKFREEVKTLDKTGERRRLVKFVTSPSDLSSKFSSSLQKFIKDPKSSLSGWRRFSADVGKNEFVQSVVNKLSEFDLLSHRCVEDRPRLKEAMGKYFWDNYGFDFVTRFGTRNLYFESGSTIAHVSAEFRDSDIFKNHRHEWRIRTNNILTYLQFILFEDIPIDLVPHGPPENKYGATYGSLLNLDKPRWPDANLPLADVQPNASRPVKELAQTLMLKDEPALILATASGLELDPKSEFQGPHAGTFVNKLLKRVLFETGHPIVLFLDEEKISPFFENGRFKVGKCHHVCDSGFPWQEICHSHPMAICVSSSSREKLEQIVEQLRAAGLTKSGHTKDVPEGAGTWVTIVRNEAFDRALGKPVIIN